MTREERATRDRLYDLRRRVALAITHGRLDWALHRLALWLEMPTR